MSRAICAWAASAAVMFATVVGHAQTTSEPSSTGDVAPGVHRVARLGAVPIRFELRGSGSEAIGVRSNGAASFESGAFTPACATPCTLWFEQGRTYVQLGQSALRTRVFPLAIDSHPRRLVFTRDQPAGVIAGVLLGGLGLIAMIIGLPFAATRPDPAPFAVAAGAGAVVLTGGAFLAGFSFGWSDLRDE